MTENDHQGRTDHIESILQPLLDAQQTGVLTMERGKGGVRDVGTIVFLYGQVVDASAAGRIGAEALDWLFTWGNCRYVYTPKAPNEIVISTPPPAAAPAASRSTSPLDFLAQILPKSAPPAASQPANGHTNPTHSTPVENRTKPYEEAIQQYFTPAPPPMQSLPPAQPMQPMSPTQPMQSMQSYQPYVPPPAYPTTDPRANNAYPQQVQIPHRLLQGPEAIAFMDRIHLPRLHRHVFFLLDGQRTTSDLARLTRHPLNEIQQLLTDLEQYGLIRQ